MDGSSGSGRVIASLSRIVELQLATEDLTMQQYRVLSYLAHQPSIPTHMALWLGVRKQSMTRMLDDLAERALLRRSPAEHDRRRVIHAVTPKGRRTLARVEARIDRAFEGVFGLLDDDAAAAEVRHGLRVAGVAVRRATDRATRGDWGAPA